MQCLGEVRVADDEDFSRLKSLCQVHDDWKQVYSKNGVFVWTKTNDVSDFNIVKVVFKFCLYFPNEIAFSTVNIV